MLTLKFKIKSQPTSEASEPAIFKASDYQCAQPSRMSDRRRREVSFMKQYTGISGCRILCSNDKYSNV